MIVYLVSQYPAPSHTFIRRELSALRRRGLHILPISVRPGVLPGDDKVVAILDAPALRLLARAVRSFLYAPARSLQTWALARGHRSAGVKGWIWAHFHLLEALALVDMLRTSGVERIHSHFANSGATVGMLTAHYLGVPWSLTLHGISETDPPAGALLPEKIQKADFVACASWFMRAQGMRTVPLEHWPKFHIVRCGVDLGHMGERGSSERRRGIRFVTVGRLSAEKGHMGLLTALRQIVTGPIDAELAIVGDGPLREELARQIDAFDLADRVLLRGALSEGEALEEIAAGDIFVLPSLMEGLPVVLMEAMALSKPVIASSVAGIPELVRDGETGLLFRPADWDDLASCMRRLAMDAKLRRRFASLSRGYIEQEYAIDVAVDPLVRLFQTSRERRDHH